MAVAVADVVVLALALGVVVWHGTPWTPPLPGASEPVVAALADLPPGFDPNAHRPGLTRVPDKP